MISAPLHKVESQHQPSLNLHITELTFSSFWYHSHLSTQYCDGLRGAIVIYGTSQITFENKSLTRFWIRSK